METQRTCEVMSLINVMILSLSSLLAWVFPAGAQRCECIEFEGLLPDQMFNVGDTFIDSGERITIDATEGPDGNPWLPGTAIVRKGNGQASWSYTAG